MIIFQNIRPSFYVSLNLCNILVDAYEFWFVSGAMNRETQSLLFGFWLYTCNTKFSGFYTVL